MHKSLLVAHVTCAIVLLLATVWCAAGLCIRRRQPAARAVMLSSLPLTLVSGLLLTAASGKSLAAFCIKGLALLLPAVLVEYMNHRAKEEVRRSA